MRLRFRLLRIIFAALCRRKDLYLDDESVLHFTVMPSDCVVNLVGNDRYHSFMDLGRLDLLIRHGGWHMLLVERLQPFVLTAHVRYFISLRMFQHFTLHTRLIHWSNTSFWMEHSFVSGRRTIATAISKNGFTCQGKVVSTEQVFNLLNGEKISSHYPQTKISVLAAIEKVLRDLKGTR